MERRNGYWMLVMFPQEEEHDFGVVLAWDVSMEKKKNRGNRVVARENGNVYLLLFMSFFMLDFEDEMDNLKLEM